MAQNKIAGTVFLKFDGEQLQLRGDLTVTPGSIERESIVGQDAVHGFKEMPRAPFIEGNFSDGAAVSLEALLKQEDVTVQAELANGKQYILRNAWLVPSPELDTSEGQMTLRWEGASCDELVSAG